MSTEAAIRKVLRAILTNGSFANTCLYPSSVGLRGISSRIVL